MLHFCIPPTANECSFCFTSLSAFHIAGVSGLGQSDMLAMVFHFNVQIPVKYNFFPPVYFPLFL
jgi:hypothetical protein